MSILSFPDRGPWGDAGYSGNCSGYVDQALYRYLQPRVLIDPMASSGTSVAVARELGIEAYGLDLKDGFNILRTSLLEAVGKAGELVLSHPPYFSMIRYSGQVWGEEPHPDDLSWSATFEEFCDKLQAALLNQQDATLTGGHYGAILGDYRKQGRYYSLQAEAIARMPRDELAGVLVKAQHHVASKKRSYALTLPRIEHEYVLLWQKRERSLYLVLKAVVTAQHRAQQGNWRSVVRQTLTSLGGRVELVAIYAHVLEAAPARAQRNSHVREKVRQTLQQYPDFESQARGVWRLA